MVCSIISLFSVSLSDRNERKLGKKRWSEKKVHTHSLSECRHSLFALFVIITHSLIPIGSCPFWYISSTELFHSVFSLFFLYNFWVREEKSWFFTPSYLHPHTSFPNRFNGKNVEEDVTIGFLFHPTLFLPSYFIVFFYSSFLSSFFRSIKKEIAKSGWK